MVNGALRTGRLQSIPSHNIDIYDADAGGKGKHAKEAVTENNDRPHIKQRKEERDANDASLATRPDAGSWKEHIPG